MISWLCRAVLGLSGSSKFGDGLGFLGFQCVQVGIEGSWEAGRAQGISGVHQAL